MALLHKEILQVLRDPVSLMIMFVMPGFMLILFGVAISLDVDNIRLAVRDLDMTTGSRELTRRFTETRYFQIVARPSDDDELTRLVDSGAAAVALTIPPGFEKKLESIQPSPVRVVIDGSDNNTADISLSYINLIIQEYSTERLLEEFKRRGIPAEEVRLPVALEPRVWYNPELVSENFFVPGLIGLVMMASTTVLTATSIVREKEKGTIEMLMVAPISRVQLVLGKIFPYFVIALVNVFILAIVSQVLFGVPFRGSLTLFFALSSLFLLTALGFGIFISTLAASQQVAWTICMLSTVLPSFILSGFIFPIESMPWGIRLFTYLVPVRYYIVILRGIILKGVGMESMMPEVAALVLFAVVTLAVSSRRVARRLT